MTTRHETDMNIEDALKNPAAFFDSPENVIDDQRLTVEQKKAVLERWKQDARLLETAAAENMAGGEPNLLHRVSEALLKLDD